MYKSLKKKKRLAFIEERLKVLKDVYDYYKTLITFNRKLMEERIGDVEGFDRLVRAESEALVKMFTVEEEIRTLEQEWRVSH